MSLVEGGRAADLLKEDLIALCHLEVIDLRVRGLVCGGAPCVRIIQASARKGTVLQDR